MHINLLKEKNSEQEAEIKTFHEAHCQVGDKANVPAQSPTSPHLSISEFAESTEIFPPEKKRRMKEQCDVFANALKEIKRLKFCKLESLKRYFLHTETYLQFRFVRFIGYAQNEHVGIEIRVLIKPQTMF